MSLHKEGGESQYICEAYGHKEKKGRPRIFWRLEETESKLKIFVFPFV